MRIVPVHIWNHPPSGDNGDGFIVRSKNPVVAKVMEERRSRLRRTDDQGSYLVDRIALQSRVIIVEGISGSGKDTFQAYVKKKLKGRDVYDYSEGEVLHSWKQLQISGVSKLRIKFMKLFVKFIRETVTRNENAVFLLNRFHLSTYASTIIQQPKLVKDYDDVVSALRILPVHVFILLLDGNEIDKRSLHPERSGAWRQFQQQIVEEHTFRQRLERQQSLILDAARTQQIPYSVIKLPFELEIVDGQVDTQRAPAVVRVDALSAKAQKHGIPQRMKETL